LCKMLKEEDFKKIFALRDEFVKQLEGWELFGYQKEASNKIIRAVLNNSGETFAFEFSRQSGKTRCVVNTVVFLFTHYFQICKIYNLPHMGFFNVGFFAPQKYQIKTDFDMLRDNLKKLEGKGYDFTFSEFNAETINMRSKLYPPRMAYCFTASPTSHPESKTLNLIIYEEAQDLDDKQIDKAIAPMGASTNATEVYVGVGGYKRCRFWNLVETLPKEKKVIVPYSRVLNEWRRRYEVTKNPRYLFYEQHINKRKREIGTECDEFKTQYELKWILERGQFITYEQLMKLEEDYTIPETMRKFQPCYGGIDWGKMNDSTVFTIVDDNCRIIYWKEFKGDDYSSQIKAIVDSIQKRFEGLKIIYCDSTGTQDMAVDVLRRELFNRKCNIRVEGVNFSSQKDMMYKNLSRLMHDIVVDGKVIERAKLRFPKKFDGDYREKFVKQFCDLQKEITTTGKWRCQHPEGPNYHDDFCDSLALACLAFTPAKEQRITFGVF